MNFFADGQELRREREKKGLSLADLARLSGVSKGSIGNFETDRRGLGKKSKLKIWTALQTDKQYNADDNEKKCLHCSELEAELQEARSDLREARAVIRDQAAALAAALAKPPSPVADLVCNVADGGREERRNA